MVRYPIYVPCRHKSRAVPFLTSSSGATCTRHRTAWDIPVAESTETWPCRAIPGPVCLFGFHREQTVSSAELTFSRTFNTGLPQLSSAQLRLCSRWKTEKKHNKNKETQQKQRNTTKTKKHNKNKETKQKLASGLDCGVNSTIFARYK